ncbi:MULTISPECIES: nucleotide disphospho-sugar-binding domain-containing protein [unclassified Streptomyces]|uniref:nucleotide disphospho-sugar-binding domain-containing protein n=1 Tax=unclassified Streptomyces TaxID=2593676 RepID=UPI002F9091A1
MRVLVMATPSPTHFTPLVPLAWALRAAGHEVLVAGQPDVLGVVRSAGLNGVGFGDAFDGEAMLLKGLEPGQRPLEARPRTAFRMSGYAGLWAAHAARWADEYLEFARAFRPDLVVSDPLEFSALMVGAVLKVPVVQHRWGVDPMSGDARPEARRALRDVCARLGLAELPDPAVLLDPCPSALQLPGAVQGKPIRYVPFNGNGPLPPWLREPRTLSGLRRVAVTLGGTLPLNGVPFARRTLRILGAEPGVELIATVDERFRRELGPLPDSVRLVDPVPLHLLFGSCEAVVHHGGAGTSMTATAFGLPQLVLPQLADHFSHGDQLAAAGAGIAFDTAAAQDRPDLLRGALADLLNDPRYAEAAAGLRSDMERMPAPSRVVTDLEQGWAGRAHR